MSPRDAAIGVFDSGVGGLTVLAALRAALPHEDLVYLGDTARVPYGTKSPASVTRYALAAAEALMARDLKALVIACNTASAVALPALRARCAPLPVFGVIEPGAHAALAATRTRHIAVIGTEGTVQGGAYQRALQALAPDAVVHAQACSVLVALAEEGWTDGPIVEAVLRRYLAPLLDSQPRADVLVLGCTHFPLFRAALASTLGAEVAVVDSAATTAREVQEALARAGLERTSGPGHTRFLVTDGPLRFARVAERFLGQTLAPEAVELVDLVAQLPD